MPTSSAITSSDQFAISNVFPKLWFSSVPEPIRFVTAANLGNIAFFKIDQALYNLVILPLSKDMPKFFQRNRETVSFFFAYLIQVGLQHFLNAALVYGIDTIATTEKYLQTLAVTYSSYSFSLIGSTIGNAILIKQGVPKNVAFWGTILGFGVINFFLLKYLMTKSNANVEVGKNTGHVSTNKKSVPPVQKRAVTKVRGGQQTCYHGGMFGIGKDLFSGIDPLLDFVRTTGSSVDHIE
jgi:hypothetical protein